jgi:hypothetical protein
MKRIMYHIHSRTSIQYAENMMTDCETPPRKLSQAGE